MLMFVASWGLVWFLVKKFPERLIHEMPATSKGDLFQAGITAALNIAACIPGYYLWKAEFIVFRESTVLDTISGLFVMFLYFDFGMYWLHRISHQRFVYPIVHEVHHRHKSVNGVSLYVMHPAEAAGFAMLLMVFLVLFSVSIYTLMIFLTFNWLYGTMGHSGLRFKNRLLIWVAGDSEFHNRHHALLKGNFGFFTGYWDGLFKTSL